MSVQSDLSVAIGIGLTLLGAGPAMEGGYRAAVASPISVVDTKPGQGPRVLPGDRVTFHFAVENESGREVANSEKRGLPYTLVYGDVGAGIVWVDVLGGVRQGSERLVSLPAEAVFGAAGVPPIFSATGNVRATIRVLRVVRASSAGASTASRIPRRR